MPQPSPFYAHHTKATNRLAMRFSFCFYSYGTAPATPPSSCRSCQIAPRSSFLLYLNVFVPFFGLANWLLRLALVFSLSSKLSEN
ncbi:hypothetical protein BDV93DRAFT_567280 [Ceratobasidium sp. AG-I]|nr:hypothetical protein BDV93DRAFT_567280 [Ceratobasidium sp. AG-I]